MIEQRSVPELLKAPILHIPEGKQPVRLLTCGVPEAVNIIVGQLQVHNFAEVVAWSPPLPSPVPGEVIRILIRYVTIRG
jgi:hypothetical protein